MAPTAFRDVMERLFQNIGSEKLTEVEKKIFLAQVMQAAGVAPEIAARVLAGEHHLFGPAGELMEKCEMKE